MAYMFAVAGPYGNSNCISGAVGLPARGAVPVAMPFAARPAGQRDQCDIAAAGGDRLQRMADSDLIRRAADVGGVHVAALQAHVVDHRHRAEAARRIAGAVIAVDVVLGQAGILQRAFGAFGVQQRDGLVRRLAGGMLPRPDDIARTL